MPRPKHVDPRISKNLCIPKSIVTHVDLLLWSDIEGRVPHGEWSELVSRLLADWLKSKGVQP